DPDDYEPGRVDVEAAHERPEPAAEPVLLPDEAEDLHGADEKRDEHRQPGDGQVVVDLADRAGEGPVVGEVHEAPVGGVEQAHAGGEQDGQRQDRVERQPAADRRAGQHQQRDLGGGVEPEPEQDADRVDLPGGIHPARERAEDPVHQAALGQLLLEFLVVVGTPAHLPEHLENPGQHDQVERGDEVEEGSRHPGADDPGEAVQAGVLVADLGAHRADAEVQQHGEHEDHRGVTEGEEEADRQRPLALAHQLARGVVDRRDVVGVEGVPHAQGVGQDPGAEPEDLRGGDVIVPAYRGGQHRPAQDVQPDDRPRHPPGAGPFGRGERVPDSCQPAVRPGRQISHRGASRRWSARTVRAVPSLRSPRPGSWGRSPWRAWFAPCRPVMSGPDGGCLPGVRGAPFAAGCCWAAWSAFRSPNRCLYASLWGLRSSISKSANSGPSPSRRSFIAPSAIWRRSRRARPAWAAILGSSFGTRPTSAITARTSSLGMDRSNPAQLPPRPPDLSGDNSSPASPAYGSGCSRARRRSLAHTMNSPASTSTAQVPPRINMVTGSGLGLAAPAIRNTPKISTRRHLANRSWVKIPARFSMMISTGTSNASPKASI